MSMKPRPGNRADRDGVDDEDDLLLRQPHDQRRVGVVEAEIVELERGAAELIAVVVDHLVRHHMCADP